jgi:hypothetical protein
MNFHFTHELYNPLALMHHHDVYLFRISPHTDKNVLFFREKNMLKSYLLKNYTTDNGFKYPILEQCPEATSLH